MGALCRYRWCLLRCLFSGSAEWGDSAIAVPFRQGACQGVSEWDQIGLLLVSRPKLSESLIVVAAQLWCSQRKAMLRAQGRSKDAAALEQEFQGWGHQVQLTVPRFSTDN
jgi:hypothetical protein